jgi:hypothetical protein
VKPWIKWALLAFVLYMIVQFPNESARMLDNTVNFFGNVAESSADFINSVLS